MSTSYTVDQSRLANYLHASSRQSELELKKTIRTQRYEFQVSRKKSSNLDDSEYVCIAEIDLNYPQL